MFLFTMNIRQSLRLIMDVMYLYVYKCIHKQRKSRLSSDLAILILASKFLLSTSTLLLNWAFCLYYSFVDLLCTVPPQSLPHPHYSLPSVKLCKLTSLLIFAVGQGLSVSLSCGSFFSGKENRTLRKTNWYITQLKFNEFLDEQYP